MKCVISKLTVLITVGSIVLLANMTSASAQTYDWSNMSETKIGPFSGNRPFNGYGPVAISGDIAVVGSSTDNYGGEVKLFKRISYGNWNAIATLGPLFWNFVYSVSISGDTVVVDGWNGIYLFTKPESGWATTATETAKLIASDLAEHVGSSVAISGDTVL